MSKKTTKYNKRSGYIIILKGKAIGAKYGYFCE